jgi:predicted lactoylglutathione lyase
MMALNLYMVGLIVQDMDRSQQFYRRLGVALPEGAGEQPMVEVKMAGELTFLLLGQAGNIQSDNPELAQGGSGPTMFVEFNLKSREAVDAKYAELTGYGYQGYRAPFESPFGYLAVVSDPDGNAVVLSA